MSEFMFLFRSSAADREQAIGTPERAQKSMQLWLTWLRELEQKGCLKNPGQPLSGEGKVVRQAGNLVTDGPYAEAKDMVLGFMIIEARDLQHAAQIAGGCPIAGGAGCVEVRPIGRLTNQEGASA
ncbi:MAG: YciI family protein [Polyangiaceae bacterium]